MPTFLESTLQPDACELDMLCAADYPSEEVRWLWPGRIPLGKLTLLAGDPGNGKSLLALDIAARVTRGADWPDAELIESRAANSRPSLWELGSKLPGSVLILSAEDDLGDTIRPRLDAAGADLSRVFILPSVTDLRNDFAEIRAAIDRAPCCNLIIIDPIYAFVGPGDSNFHTVVRRVVQPLVKLAAARGIAVLGITHLRKNEGAAIQRAMGSMGYVAAARAVWTVCKDGKMPGRNLFLPLKNNFAAETSGLGFTIESSDCDTPRISWQQESIATSAADAQIRPEKIDAHEAAEIDMACEWLKQELADGPKEAFIIFGDGVMGGGFTQRTLRRALHRIGGQTAKTGYIDGWKWSLPNSPRTGQKKSDQGTVSRDSKSLSPVPSPPTPLKCLSPSADACPLPENPEEFDDIRCPLPEIPEDFEYMPFERGRDDPFFEWLEPSLRRSTAGRSLRVISLKSGPLAAFTAQSQIEPHVIRNRADLIQHSTTRKITRRPLTHCRDP